MQVWFKNRKVGEASVPSPTPGMRKIRMMTLRPPSPTGYRSSIDPPLPIKAEEILLPLDVARFSITSEDLLRGGNGYVGMVMEQHGVRSHECESWIDHNRDVTIYQYKIIRVTLSLLEEIFDYDWFEPVDGERDPLFDQDLNVARLSALSANIGPISTGQIKLSSGIRLNVRA